MSLEALLHDVRFAIRILRRNPGFTAAAVLSLAIGIGANTSVFSILYAVLIRDLPVSHPEELVLVRKLVGGSSYNSFSYPAFLAVQQNQRALQALLGSGDLPLRSAELPSGEALTGIIPRSVTRNYFSMMGVSACRGRVFNVREDDPAAVISYRFWERQFAGNTAALGSTLVFNGVPVTIVGIMPSSFFGEAVGQSPDVYVPIDQVIRIAGANYVQNDRNHWVSALGRLKPGVSFRDAESSLNAAFQSTPEFQRSRGANRDIRVVAEPGRRGLRAFRDRFEKALQVLMALSSLLLLIACCNVANLLLARATARRRETGVRLAVGAAGSRLLQQFMTESLILSVAGGLGALWVAALAGPALVALASDPANPIYVDSRPDWRVFAFAIAVSAFATLLFGLAPALRSVWLDLASELKAGTGGGGPDRRGHHLGKSLVIIQIALSLMLLIGAGLFVRTLSNLRNQDPGFRPQNVLVAQLTFEVSRAGLDRLSRLGPSVVERLSALPGVQTCGLSTYGGMTRGHQTTSVSLPDRQGPPGADFRLNHVSPGYFGAYGIDLIAGRTFQATDTPKSRRVVVINNSTARRLFSGEYPVGKTISLREVFDPKESLEIIGVVRDAKYTDLREEMPAQLFLPLTQSTSPGIFVVLRSTVNPAALAVSLRQAIRQIDSQTSFAAIRTLEESVESTLVQERMMARLSALFGLVSLVLVCVGIYGVISYALSLRIKEIGIRIAVGASRAAVLGMVLREAAVLIGAGVALGLAAASATTRYLASLLYGLTPGDPATVMAMIAFLIAAGLFAAYVPAHRASRVNPVTALRLQ